MRWGNVDHRSGFRVRMKQARRDMKRLLRKKGDDMSPKDVKVIGQHLNVEALDYVV